MSKKTSHSIAPARPFRISAILKELTFCEKPLSTPLGYPAFWLRWPRRRSVQRLRNHVFRRTAAYDFFGSVSCCELREVRSGPCSSAQPGNESVPNEVPGDAG